MVNAETKRWLDGALKELTDRQRFIVECWFGLRGDREYSFREIAGFMGVDVAAVKRHYDRARKKLEQQADGQQLDILGRGAVTGNSAKPSADRHSGVESVCLSPFIQLHEGYPPGALPPGVKELLFGDSEDA